MRVWLRKWWRVLKWLLVLAILAAFGREFWRELQRAEAWRQNLQFNWFILSGVLYLFGLGFLAAYWYRLLLSVGQRPTFLGALRAHYIGQMGKYVPGKAWALVLRASLVRSPDVNVGIAVQTSFYEVLADMTVGASLAAVLFWLFGPRTSASSTWTSLGKLLTLRDPQGIYPGHSTLALLALIVLLPVAVLVVPAVFNRLAQRLAHRLGQEDSQPLPRMGYGSLLQGYVLATLSWAALGASLWAMIHAVGAVKPDAGLRTLGFFTAIASFSYVAGFLIVFIPSGIGVREYFLILFLTPEIHNLLHSTQEAARGKAFLVAVFLRIVWMATEALAVGILFWLPTGMKRHGP
jgi:uncharacterized membrane protein YbhN (UPF0104 family)